MYHAQPESDFRVAANELYSAVDNIVLACFLDDLTPAGMQGVRDPLSLVASLVAEDGPKGDEIEAVLVRRDALVRRGGKQASGARHSDGVLTRLFNANVRPVARHVGDVVRAWIVDLSQQLFRSGRWNHESVRAFQAWSVRTLQKGAPPQSESRC